MSWFFRPLVQRLWFNQSRHGVWVSRRAVKISSFKYTNANYFSCTRWQNSAELWTFSWLQKFLLWRIRGKTCEKKPFQENAAAAICKLNKYVGYPLRCSHVLVLSSDLFILRNLLSIACATYFETFSRAATMLGEMFDAELAATQRDLYGIFIIWKSKY